MHAQGPLHVVVQGLLFYHHELIFNNDFNKLHNVREQVDLSGIMAEIAIYSSAGQKRMMRNNIPNEMISLEERSV